jgi:hypothetical protein
MMIIFVSGHILFCKHFGPRSINSTTTTTKQTSAQTVHTYGVFSKYVGF